MQKSDLIINLIHYDSLNIELELKQMNLYNYKL